MAALGAGHCAHMNIITAPSVDSKCKVHATTNAFTAAGLQREEDAWRACLCIGYMHKDARLV